MELMNFINSARKAGKRIIVCDYGDKPALYTTENAKELSYAFGVALSLAVRFLHKDCEGTVSKKDIAEGLLTYTRTTMYKLLNDLPDGVEKIKKETESAMKKDPKEFS